MFVLNMYIDPTNVEEVGRAYEILGRLLTTEIEATDSESEDAHALLPDPGCRGGAVMPTELTTPTTPTVELDSEGFAWDQRIHSSAKSKIANGTWKVIRGIDQEFVAVVKKELRPGIAAPPPPPALDDYISLVNDIADSEIDADTVLKVLDKVGVANLAILATRPDLVAAVREELGL